MITGIIALLIVICFFSYLFLIMPNVSTPADTESLAVSYAHRGLWSAGVPENSMAAFANAVQKGYGIRLDVQLSKDKRLIVFGDRTLRRMCGVDQRVCEMSCAELKALRLKGSDQTIVTLPEVLAAVGGRVPLMIEVRGADVPRALCIRLAKALDSYQGAFSVVSLNPKILGWFKGYRPRFARGQIVTHTKDRMQTAGKLSRLLSTHMLLNFISRPDFISVRVDLRRRPSVFLMTRVLRLRGFAWTVKSRDEWQACRRAGWLCIFEKFEPRRTNAERKQR